MIVYVDPLSETAAFFDRSVLIVISGFFRNFILAIIVFFSFYLMISKPLLDIISSIVRIEAKDGGKMRLSVPKGHTKDEFGVLVNSANQFLQTIDEDVEMIKKTEETLRESEEKFRTLTVCSPVGMFLDDAQGNAIYINEKCAELVGMPAEEALNLD